MRKIGADAVGVSDLTSFVEAHGGVLSKFAFPHRWPARAERGSRPDRAHPTRRAVAVGATAAAVLVGGGSWYLGQPAGGSDPGATSCAAELTFSGTTYAAQGNVLRVPRPGRPLGTAMMPRCDDGQGPSGARESEVFAVPGVGPADALFTEAAVWLRSSLTRQPAGSGPLFRKVACAAGSPTTIAGLLTGVAGPPVERDYELRAPYTATVMAEEGNGLPLRRFSAVELRVRVTGQTSGATDAALIRALLGEGERASVAVRCAGTRFVATALRRAAP